ncbi:Hsp20/alpha crystallin family protein [Levilactobacillus bambusae]|uniref:Hsp20/alpha crystallin family protein n=1 Tax=Levilactobacillus bambusae TaxID=2024736 RepID=A0A2V1MXT6_9LACO|nr:Hsp20/alpha crystallin family protein [Levilactobacillus bambusae]PWF99860.1 Hsp20/alpha crystallin family protein [Levilactobacillus bambusae]
MGNLNLDPKHLFNQVGEHFNQMVAPKLMKTDIVETKTQYLVDVDLPGFKKRHLHVDYREDTLRIAAKYEAAGTVENSSDHLMLQERLTEDLSRAFYLPNVDRDKIEATFEDGVLHLSLPKINQDGEGMHNIPIE